MDSRELKEWENHSTDSSEPQESENDSTDSSELPERFARRRKIDVSNIPKLVLSDEPSDANFQVIPIVGRGVEKTKLARKVYNDEAIEGFEFDIKAWLCISQDFNVLSISRALLESITSVACDLKALNEVQVQLRKAVDGKKFLLVLDDVCTDYSLWEILTAPFTAGAPTSKIIVTTYDNDFASTIATVQPYAVQPYDWQALTLVARGGPSGPYLHIWDGIVNTNILDFSQQKGILSVLRLSYRCLPSHLKRCFTYCAIFPKNYEFQKKELVLLWMAEGIIQQSRNNKHLEDWGSECFDDLLSRSIFQQSKGDRSKFRMHDLFHDLAQLVSGKVRHASYSRGEFDGKHELEILSQTKHLRTFLPVRRRVGTDISYITITFLSDLLPKLKKLRVLSLAGYYITQLPDSVKDLLLLKYLNLAGTMIKSLPESTCSLFNLQTLILRNCLCLMKLPSKMRSLIELRHLDIQGADSLKEMPQGMKQLTNLQTLSNFIVGKGGTASSLKDLKMLTSLCGELCISGLENMHTPQNAREAVLCEKKNLEALSLRWGPQFDNSRDAAIEENVLNMLEPHNDIKRLTITCYGGESFPFWMGDGSLCKMEALTLENCENCKSLPSLGLLRSLKRLTIKGMKLKSISSEMYGEACSKPFQSLEALRFENLQEWESWDANIKDRDIVETFPCLRELSIVGCPKLSGRLPDHLQSLETLVVSDCEELVVSFSRFPMLCKLEIDGCKGLICSSTPIDPEKIKCVTISKTALDIYGCKGMLFCSPNELLMSSVTISEFGKFLKQRFHQVETLAIGDSEQINSWRQNGVFQSEKPVQGTHILTHADEASIAENSIHLDLFPQVNFLLNNLLSLKIEKSRALKFLPEKMMGNNSKLERLYVRDCYSLTFIARGKLPSSLKRLEIFDCHNLQRLVDDVKDASSSSPSSSSSSSSVTLKHLEISNCPTFISLASEIQLLEELEYLHINDCPKLESLPDGLRNLNCLQEIHILDCSSLVCFPERGLPSTISDVRIGRCEKLESLPDDMHKLNSLRNLSIMQCPSILSAREERLPSRLTSLEIDNLEIYKVLTQQGLPRSLKCLYIHGCHNAESFPDRKIPMMMLSLTELRIHGFQKLKRLSFCCILKKLWIENCPKLKSFPESGLPSSLLHLIIRDCPLLKKQCKRGKGKEWSKIAHIPCVEIDNKFIYDPEEEA